MNDRLKLSDPNGDAEVDRIAVALTQKEDADHIRTLQKNIAALQVKLAKQKANGGLGAERGGSNKVGARKHASFMAISTAPSINWTPLGPTKVPIAYPTVQDLFSSVNTARTVNFNGCPVYLLDASTQPHCTGDERGTAKGIKSGTVSGEVKPLKGSSTVRIEGKQVVRDGDPCTMNEGNNPGIYVVVCQPSSAPPKTAIETSNPPTARGGFPAKMKSESGDGLKVQSREITPEQTMLLTKGDFMGFWRSRYWDSNDPVARTALIGWGQPGVVYSPQVFERVAASFTWTMLGQYLQKVNNVANVNKEMQKIGLDLARAHALAVTKDIAENHGVPGLLSPNQVAAYHWQVFQSHQVPPELFGGTMLGIPAGTYSEIWCNGCDKK